jgi:hypothetical protein
MPEPHLDLLGVEAVAEQHRCARVPERVEADPRSRDTLSLDVDPLAESSLDRCRLEHSRPDV